MKTIHLAFLVHLAFLPEVATAQPSSTQAPDSARQFQQVGVLHAYASCMIAKGADQQKMAEIVTATGRQANLPERWVVDENRAIRNFLSPLIQARMSADCSAHHISSAEWGAIFRESSEAMKAESIRLGRVIDSQESMIEKLYCLKRHEGISDPTLVRRLCSTDWKSLDRGY